MRRQNQSTKTRMILQSPNNGNHSDRRPENPILGPTLHDVWPKSTANKINGGFIEDFFKGAILALA